MKGEIKMQILNECELYKIEGGAIKKSLVVGLLALGVLITGIIDGLLRPLKCRS